MISIKTIEFFCEIIKNLIQAYMENEIQEDPMLKEASNKMMLLICEAISSSSTEDRIWVPLERIKDYVQTYYEGNFRDIEKYLVPTLRMSVEQELIIRRANTFCFMSAETYQLQFSNEKKKKQKKTTKNMKNPAKITGE